METQSGGRLCCSTVLYSLRSKRSCSKEELPNDFSQTGRAKVGSLDPTFARPVCGKSFGSSSFEQERLLRRLCLVEQSRRCRMTSTSTPEDSLQSHVKGLEFLKEIGKGSYGIVYRAKWNGEEVAAKRFHPIFFENGFCQEDMIDFQRERAVLEKTNHPNIVKLKTVLLPKRAPPIIITELLHCDLEKYIQVSKTSPKVSENNLIQIATDVIKGLEYMHGLDPPIVHRDLATKNILLTVNGNAKIADFGVSKAFSAGRDMNASIVPGTPDYAAPETYPAMNQFQMTGEPMYGPKVDVFSFGAVLLCMIVGHEPRVKPPCPITKGNYPLLRVY